MKGKKLVYLSALLVVIVAIIILSNKLGTKTPSEKEVKFFPSTTGQSIGTISITDGTASIKLRRKGDVWVVSNASASAVTPAGSPLATNGDVAAGTEYPVDSASIASALEKALALKKGALISENPEKQALFEVDSVKGLLVQLGDAGGKSIGSVFIGKSGADWNSNYVRTKGSNQVYLASGGVKYAFFTELNRWRDKSVLKFDKTTAKGLTLAHKDSGMVTLAKADTGSSWMILEPVGSPAKTEAVEGVLEKLAQFNATEFQDSLLPDSAMGFDKPVLGVTVSFKNGSSRNLIFGKKNSDNKYWVKTDGKEQIFMVAEYTFNDINKKLVDFKADAPVKPVDPAMMK